MRPNILKKVSIEGLKYPHFNQLLHYLLYVEEKGEYYGDRERFDKRHEEIKDWLVGVLDQICTPNNKIG